MKNTRFLGARNLGGSVWRPIGLVAIFILCFIVTEATARKKGSFLDSVIEAGKEGVDAVKKDVDDFRTSIADVTVENRYPEEVKLIVAGENRSETEYVIPANATKTFSIEIKGSVKKQCILTDPENNRYGPKFATWLSPDNDKVNWVPQPSQDYLTRRSEAPRPADQRPRVQEHGTPDSALSMSSREKQGRPRESGAVVQERVIPDMGMTFVYVPELNVWVGKYEVTNEEYRRYRPSHTSGSFENLSLDDPRQPAANLSYDDAEAYAQWLTAREQTAGRLPQTARFHLPTGNEWQIFSQCGDDRQYPWGNKWPPPPEWNYYGNEGVDPRLRKPGGYDHRDAFPVSCAVDTSVVNDWGLYGVGGNVWEWTSDRGDDVDIRGTRASTRMLRGSSWWCNDPSTYQCSHRARGIVDKHYPDRGCRLVLDGVSGPTPVTCDSHIERIAGAQRPPGRRTLSPFLLIAGGVAVLVGGVTILALRLGRKTCPYCAEKIRVGAKYCRFCQKDIPA